MNIEKSGKLICEERKKLGLTQKELAEIIGVTDKAVSKWENGRGFPDISLLEPLSKALNISVTELIHGEKTENNTFKASDKTIMEVFSQRKLLLNMISIIFTIIGAALLFLPTVLAAAGFIGILFILLGSLLIALGIIIRSKKFLMCAEKVNLKFLYTPLALFAIISAIVLEAQPNSFLMIFGAPPDSGVEAFYESCSYFDLLPFGYGNWAPLLTALTSCASAVLLAGGFILDLLKKTLKKLNRAAFICTCSALLFSATAIFLFSDQIAAAESGIALLIITSAIFQFSARKA